MSESTSTPAVTNHGAHAHAHIHHHHHHHHHHHIIHHHHGHAHTHAHVKEGDMAEANRNHFNANAADFEKFPAAKARAALTARKIREVVELSKDSSSVLDFACGTGLVSKELIPFVQEIVGVDISEVLVERYNQRFKDDESNCAAVAANILTDKDVLSGRKFDLVFCASSYHHFEFPKEMTKLLANYMKPGGSLVIVDGLMKGGGVIRAEHRGRVTGYGFTEEKAKDLVSGVEGLSLASFVQVRVEEEGIDIFLLRAIKS